MAYLAIPGYDYPHNYDEEELRDKFPDECPICSHSLKVIDCDTSKKTIAVECTNCNYEDNNYPDCD